MAFLVFFAFTSAAAGVQATECPGASQAQPLYPDYNPTTSDFYTTSRGLSRPWIHSRGHQSQRLHRGRRWHRAPPTLLQFRRLKTFLHREHHRSTGRPNPGIGAGGPESNLRLSDTGLRRGTALPFVQHGNRGSFLYY
ncbi:hypothetical protein C8F04DRAFT_477911 [Mycena alexandri]|uniref:Secreted protein n=1 Tax=Mycena alexandri TaxID=1745969 RepID=A0AAD6X5L6_9AGAR|nr:hypothetical protein C8F04DRAFT_477911 [Mycena alexandri]